MALILNIDSSTDVCSVALAADAELISLKESNEGLNHSLLLAQFVKEVLVENGLEGPLGLNKLDAIAVSMGPGSYTGLRIGVSLAKGLCFAASKPLLAVNTLQALTFAALREIKKQKIKTQEIGFQEIAAPQIDQIDDNARTWYCPMLDARRMEVYTAFYDHNMRTMIDTKAEVIDTDSFADILNEHKVWFFGNGSDKIRSILHSPNAHFLGGMETSAVNMLLLADEKFKRRQFEDLAYFEPFYLKDFIATTPRKNVLMKK
ncbi:tRNA (adenosine(37)-N6)-threonylcarbamoyltransferase complex dimerization subunit type 1 TsaB [Bacteroidia bacterium]|nr:tRNA (adenosine(37)-N6)-threonylcarbamoyltransferase complex dimerization subunit type 1 TsaB [Bacteroidia bacterium]